MPSTNNELTQRDLLIKLSIQLHEFKEYTKEKFDDLDKSISGISKIRTQVARIDERVRENTKLRSWVYGSLVTGFISASLALISLNK